MMGLLCNPGGAKSVMPRIVARELCDCFRGTIEILFDDELSKSFAGFDGVPIEIGSVVDIVLRLRNDEYLELTDVIDVNDTRGYDGAFAKAVTTSKSDATVVTFGQLNRNTSAHNCRAMSQRRDMCIFESTKIPSRSIRCTASRNDCIVVEFFKLHLVDLLRKS